MAHFHKDSVTLDVATRLRQLRKQSGLSMRDLASRSGLSANAISTIERGKSSPSVSTLSRLAQALNVSILDFFKLPSKSEKVVFINAKERKGVPFRHGLTEDLGSKDFSGRMKAYMFTLESGANSMPTGIAHKGDDFILCMSGHLEIQVEDDIFELKTGDSILFDATLHHRWRNVGKTTTNILLVLSDFSDAEQSIALQWKSGTDKENPM